MLSAQSKWLPVFHGEFPAVINNLAKHCTIRIVELLSIIPFLYLGGPMAIVTRLTRSLLDRKPAAVAQHGLKVVVVLSVHLATLRHRLGAIVQSPTKILATSWICLTFLR